MTRAWAPNGHDVVDWPAGNGLAVTGWADDARDLSEDARARIAEGARKGVAASTASRRARAAQRAEGAQS